MAAQVRRNKKSEFVAKLEEVLPLLRERFGVAKIGIFGSTARGDDRPESDVDVLVELSPDRLAFRNFSALADFLEELYGRKSTCSPSAGLILSSGRTWRAKWSGVKRDEIFLRHMPTNRSKGRKLLAFPIQERSSMIAVLHTDGVCDHHTVHRN